MSAALELPCGRIECETPGRVIPEAGISFRRAAFRADIADVSSEAGARSGAAAGRMISLWG